MSQIIQAIENEQLKKDVPDFKQGDTVVVKVKVKEGNRERLQAFEGVVIAIRNRGLNSSFIVRKISNGEGVERTFQTHSPSIDSIAIKRRGDVRKAKLYHLRELSGRAARIKEKIGRKNNKPTATATETQEEIKAVEQVEAEVKEETKPAEQPETTVEVKAEEKTTEQSVASDTAEATKPEETKSE